MEGYEFQSRVIRKRVALIGHSCAGKTTCLRILGIDLLHADMDKALGKSSCNAGVAKDRAQGAMTWLCDGSRPSVVTICNVEEILKVMVLEKASKPLQFRGLYILYLHRSIQELSDELEGRPLDQARYTMENYSRFHKELYCPLADEIVECTDKTAESVASDVLEISSRIRRNV